jgi:serine/threonine protein kinase
LLDWGVARIMGTGDPMSDVIAGTPRYVAPEQVYGEPVTPASDIYSLGVALYELLLGEPPFPGRSSAELLDQHVNDPPPRPRDRCPDIPGVLDRLLISMLAKRPERRPSLAEIERALIAARAELRARRRREEPAVVRPWTRRRWLAAAVTIGLIASGITWRVFGDGPAPADARAALLR